jgi:hypothetical protein
MLIRLVPIGVGLRDVQWATLRLRLPNTALIRLLGVTTNAGSMA